MFIRKIAMGPGGEADPRRGRRHSITIKPRDSCRCHDMSDVQNGETAACLNSSPYRFRSQLVASSERSSDQATDRAIERATEQSSDRESDRVGDRANDRAIDRAIDWANDRAIERASARAIEQSSEATERPSESLMH